MSSEADLRESEALTSARRSGSVKRRKWIRGRAPLKHPDTTDSVTVFAGSPSCDAGRRKRVNCEIATLFGLSARLPSWRIVGNSELHAR